MTPFIKVSINYPQNLRESKSRKKCLKRRKKRLFEKLCMW